MAYSKMGDSEQGRKDEKIGREEGTGDVNMSDQPFLFYHMSKENWLRRSQYKG